MIICDNANWYRKTIIYDNTTDIGQQQYMTVPTDIGQTQYMTITNDTGKQ